MQCFDWLPLLRSARDDTKNDCEGDFLHSDMFTAFWSFPSYPDHYLILSQMEEDISPTLLNVAAESSSKFTGSECVQMFC